MPRGLGSARTPSLAASGAVSFHWLHRWESRTWAPQPGVENRGVKTTHADSTTPRSPSRSSLPFAARPHFGADPTRPDPRVSLSLAGARRPFLTFRASRGACPVEGSQKRGPDSTPGNPLRLPQDRTRGSTAGPTATGTGSPDAVSSGGRGGGRATGGRGHGLLPPGNAVRLGTHCTLSLTPQPQRCCLWESGGRASSVLFIGVVS